MHGFFLSKDLTWKDICVKGFTSNLMHCYCFSAGCVHWSDSDYKTRGRGRQKFVWRGQNGVTRLWKQPSAGSQIPSNFYYYTYIYCTQYSVKILMLSLVELKSNHDKLILILTFLVLYIFKSCFYAISLFIDVPLEIRGFL